MKKQLKYVLVIMLVAGIIVSCHDKDEGPSREEIARLWVEEMRTDSEVLDDVWTEGIIITSENYNAIPSFNTRDNFLAFMQGEAVVPMQQIFGNFRGGISVPAASWPARAGLKVKKYLLNYPVGYEGPNPGAGLLDLWWKEIEDSLARKGGGGQQIHIESWSLGASNPTSAGDISPTEQLAVNYTRVVYRSNQIRELILAGGSTVNDQLNDLVAAAPPEEKLFISLLLPAVQGVREANLQIQALINVGTEGLSGSERQRFIRDLQLCAMYSALDYMISSDYSPDDHHLAMLSVAYQMQQGVTTLLWSKGYDQH